MKYITRSAYWDEDAKMQIVSDGSITVFEESDSCPTGVLDKHGNEFYRVRERVKTGFVSK
tara:strand:- start:411 stop:590 length:180 start_codon:yes stop_codon:yes gene_type:complete